MSQTKVSVVGQLKFSEDQGRLTCSVEVGKGPQRRTGLIDVSLHKRRERSSRTGSGPTATFLLETPVSRQRPLPSFFEIRVETPPAGVPRQSAH